MLVLIGVAILVWVLYQMGSKLGNLTAKRDRLIREISGLSTEKSLLDGMVKEVRKSYEKQIEEYGVKIKEEREKRRVEMESNWSEYKEARLEIVDREVAKIKSQKFAQLGVEIGAEKQAAVDRLEVWMESEKSRLQTRLDRQYEQKIADLKLSLEEKVLFEVEKVRGETLAENGEEVTQLKGEIAGLVKSIAHDVVKGIE
jgi:hypothetical protein